MKGVPVNKIILTDEQIDFIKANHSKMSNKKLADSLGLKVTTVRTRCYEMGLYKMRLEYWTNEQVEFLKLHYDYIGDTELAQLFETRWPKDKGWSKKHIEKKRRYLGLKRTKNQIDDIRKRNTEAGMYAVCNKKRWIATGVTPLGKIKIWNYKSGRKFKVIKTEDGFIRYAPFLYKQHYGEVPDGMVIRFKDNDPMNVNIENLECITREENALRNSILRYPPELRETATLLQQIKKQLKN